MKKAVSTIINVICVIIIVLAIIILGSVVLSRGSNQPSIMGYSMFRVLTPSMEPVIPTNSLIIVKKADASEVQVGDIITFYSSDPTIAGYTNTHRVTGIDDSTGSPVFTTKGDNNLIEDRYPVPASDLVGKVVLISHVLGVILSLVSNPLIFGAIVIIPLAVIFILNIKDLIKSAKELEEYELKQTEKDNEKSTDR